MRFLIICIFSLFLSHVADTALADELSVHGEMIRVAILKSQDQVTITGDGLLAVSDSGSPVPVSPPLAVRALRGAVQVDGRTLRSLKISAAGAIMINNKPYRGTIELITLNGNLVVINELPLEQYLVGVINSEISSTWPMESIKVQAVIARTYAVFKRNERSRAPYHLEATVMDQVYNGSELEDSRAARGVYETAGQVLTYNGAVIQAFYHANCGGHTEDVENVWGFSLPYLKGVDCQYCAANGQVGWEQAIPLSKIESLLRGAGHKVYGLVDIKPGSRNSRGRLKTVLLITERGTMSIPATKFRMAVGSTTVKSTDLTVRVDGGMAYFRGTGYGHGVGLCQWGAKQRALDGFSYAEILLYYYPGTELVSLPDQP
jgi:stage II sporulation protein D